MRRRRSLMAGLLGLLLSAFVLVPGVAAASADASPGACNMLHANSNGLAGMDGSGLGPGQGNGLANMIHLVVSSFGTGCTP